MPDLNLNEEGAMEEQTPSEEPSQPEAEPLRHARGGQATRVVVILVGLGVLVGVAYILNTLGIVKLWDTKEPVVAQVEEQVQQAEQEPAQEAAQQPEQQQPQQPAQQTETQETKAAQAPPQPAKQETPQVAEMKPVETPAIEAKPQANEEQKVEEPPKMLFKLKDPIAVSSRPRPERTMAKEETAAPAKEEMTAKPKEEPATKPQQEAPAKPIEEMTPPKKEAPKEEVAAQPKKETPAQPKKQTASPKKETVTQAVQPKQQTPAKPKQEMPKVNAGKMADMKGTYTIQVFALQDKENADVIAGRLTEAGYPAFVEQVEAKGKTWHTVRIGKYPSVSDAKKAVEGFAKELKVHHVIDKVRMKAN